MINCPVRTTRRTWFCVKYLCTSYILPTCVPALISIHTNSQSDGDDDEPEETCSTFSASEALKAAETLNVFVQTNFDDDVMKNMKSRIHNAKRSSYYRTKIGQKQTKITEIIFLLKQKLLLT